MSNIPEQYKSLESLSAAELEAEVQKYRLVDGASLSDEELSRVVAIMTIARRKTAGPPKAKGKVSAPVANLEDLGL